MSKSEIIDRHGVAKILCASPAAISSRVTRRDWSAVPEPFKIGRNYYWLKNVVEDWILNKASKGIGSTKPLGRGRPRKTRSASC